MADTLPYVMTPGEVLVGFVSGTDGTLPPDEGLTPRQALERAVLPALLRPPCGVAFSGGRDSSLVLAVALDVARREGLPEPVAITRIFPDDEASQEHEWQDRVVRHLGATEWQRITLHDELDLVGPIAQRHLLEHGVLWPTTLAADVPLVAVVNGGSLLDGEGGDDVLGDAMHRVAPLAWLLRHPRPVRRRRLRRGLAPLAPVTLRLRAAHRSWDTDDTPWLRAAGRSALVERFVDEERARPLSFAASLRRLPIERLYVLAFRNRRIRASPDAVAIHSPLVDPQVVHALARHGGRLGPGDRTTVLGAVAGDLLPEEVVSRVTKAHFTHSYLGRHTRDFAARWTGAGVDHTLVDVEALRSMWLGDEPHALTAALLQQAWVAECGGG